MKHAIKLIKKGLIISLIFSLIYFSSFNMLYADQISWTEVANTNSKKQFIDINSIKYNSKGLLSVLIKSSEINPDNQEIINTNSYVMAIDCENRLYSKIPSDDEINKVKNWINPINDKLIKKTIINSCSY